MHTWAVLSAFPRGESDTVQDLVGREIGLGNIREELEGVILKFLG